MRLTHQTIGQYTHERNKFFFGRRSGGNLSFALRPTSSSRQQSGLRIAFQVPFEVFSSRKENRFQADHELFNEKEQPRLSIFDSTFQDSQLIYRISSRNAAKKKHLDHRSFILRTVGQQIPGNLNFQFLEGLSMDLRLAFQRLNLSYLNCSIDYRPVRFH